MNNVILDQTVRQRGNTKLNIFTVCQVAAYIRTNNVTLERTVKTTREYKVEHSHNTIMILLRNEVWISLTRHGMFYDILGISPWKLSSLMIFQSYGFLILLLWAYIMKVIMFLLCPLLWKYFYSLVPIFVVSTKCSDAMGSWIRGFKQYRPTIYWKIVFR
jgi:phosphoglycerol transferase MdoB-like AlkP superfamily enzyme